MPTVARLSITPVKSLLLHHPDEVLLEPFGVAADHRFYLAREDGRLLAGIHHGALALVRADWDAARDRLRLAFPDGEVVEGDVRLSEPVATDFWEHRVPGRVVTGPWAEALTRFVGRPVRLVKTDEPAGGVDVEPLTLVSSESVAELARRASLDGLDARRFRMLLEIQGCAPHEEDTWHGRRVRLGEAVVEVGGPVARCVTTTRDPATGQRDFDALRAIAAYRGRRNGEKVDFGVYARVVEPGRVRVGDPVEPAPA
ncbi:MAG TPA: MOSC domain-containing protein [Gaiellaceae bacterium]|nr:MOSC domain-containing protein [Gaiellaceae bacterium]